VSALAGVVAIPTALAAWACAGLGMGIAYQTATAAAMRTSSPGNEGATGAALGMTDALAIAASTGVCGIFLRQGALAPGVTPRSLLTGFALAAAFGVASLWTARRLRASAPAGAPA
jgi:hypothetical protein